MAFPIFPTSPLPADFSRKIDWKASRVEYDTGLGQGTSALQKPLYEYGFRTRNTPLGTANSLECFYNDRKAWVEPFWIKDPYQHIEANSGLVVINTGQVSPNTLFYRTVRSWHYWPDSATFSGAYTSNTTGTLTFGVDYVLDQETGLVTFSLQADSNDWFTQVGTQEYFKKAVFDTLWRSASPRVFGQFNINLTIRERAR